MPRAKKKTITLEADLSRLGIRATPILKVLADIHVRGGTRDGSWGQKKIRVWRERQAVFDALKGHQPPSMPVDVVITRIARQLQDADNCLSGLKHPIDALCEWLGVDDGFYSRRTVNNNVVYGGDSAPRILARQERVAIEPAWWYSSKKAAVVSFPRGALELVIFPRGAFKWPFRYMIL